MNKLEIEYRVNEQGMIVEEIMKSDGDELAEKIDPKSLDERAIPENAITGHDLTATPPERP